MTTIQFLSELRRLNIKLWVEGDRLRYSAPKGTLTPALRTELSERNAELLGFLCQAKVASPTCEPLQPVPRTAKLPLSFAQQRLWFLDQLTPGSSVYNISGAVEIQGSLNVAALEQSLNETVCRHEIWRTTFKVVDGEPLQVIAPSLTLRLKQVDLRQLPKEQQQAEVTLLAIKEAQQPFDLSTGPLLQATLLQLDEVDYVLLVTIHHIVFDAWSMGVLIRELAALYEANSYGTPHALPTLPYPVRGLCLLAATVACGRGAFNPACLLETKAGWQLALVAVAHRPFGNAKVPLRRETLLQGCLIVRDRRFQPSEGQGNR